MIFLFFGTSLAHLEAELYHFKERSVFATSRFWQILTDLQTAKAQVPDEQQRIQKKGKSSEFNPRDDEQVKSGPAVKVQSREGFILTSKINQIGKKNRVSNVTPKYFPRSTGSVFSVYKIQIPEINCKIKSIIAGLVKQTLYFFF